MKKNAIRVIFGLISIYFCTIPVFAANMLIPVGKVIGLELYNDTVTVVAFDDALPAARESGLQIGDEIRKIDDHAIESSEDVRRALNSSDGSVDLTVVRSGRERQIHMEPEITAEGPKLGVYLRQGVTGIGTVTWYDPETDTFATLGHAVNDGRGNLLQMSRGNAYPATVVSVQKGKAGAPGQLKGALNTDVLLGRLSGNTVQGVFGTAPDAWQGQAIPVASCEQIHVGDAVIRATVSDGEPEDYSVEIIKIYPKSRSDGRNMLIHVTDPELLAATGGIVQGMGVSYNKDNLEKPLACKGFWCRSLFLLTSKIACIKRRYTWTESPKICDRDVWAKSLRGVILLSFSFTILSNHIGSCHTG